RFARQSRGCAPLVAVISCLQRPRAEGYFRLEWHFADQRTLLMARSKAFIVSVCIDDTTEADVEVPESFRAVQWMRLPEAAPTPAFREHIASLLQIPAAKVGRSHSNSRAAAASELLPLAAADVIKVGPFELMCSERLL